MKRVAIAHGLVLDEDMYGVSKEALSRCAPEQVKDFTWERFVDRLSWFLVPDVERPGEWFKAELKVKSGPPYKQTVKLNVWRSADVRRSGAPMPHSHPWEWFQGNVLLGGYEDDQYTVEAGKLLHSNPYIPHDLGTVRVRTGCLHQKGSVNKIPGIAFHEVMRVLEPDRTVSLMVCGPSKKEGWGYLDPDTGLYKPHEKSLVHPKFKELKLALNPHLRKG